MEYGLLLYGFQNVLEELLAPMSRQTTVLSLGGDAYLILLDADESGGAYDALCSSLESFHSFAKQELHLGLTCLLGRSAVPFRELPAEYLRLQEAHRNNVARTCGVLPLESGAAPPDVEPDFAKWQSLLDEGLRQGRVRGDPRILRPAEPAGRSKPGGALRLSRELSRTLLRCAPAAARPRARGFQRHL